MMRKQTTNNKQQTIRGFTLVETLVAIAILSIAITGPIVIAQKGLSSALYDQDEVTATYLAQDAIEYVRNVRDDNRINSVADWLSPFDTTCMASGDNCQIDTANTTAGTVTACSGGVCPVLDINSSGLYGYNGDVGYTNGASTIFTRTVTISYVAGTTNEALVTSKVSWQTNIFTTTQSVTVSEHIFNL